MLICFLLIGQMEHTGQSFVSSDPEDCDMIQDCVEERKYPGEVTTPSFKVKFQPKDAKKELLSWVTLVSSHTRGSVHSDYVDVVAAVMFY